MRAVVIGAGAVGLGVGSCLLRAGVGVLFVSRGDSAAALRRDGLDRTGLFGTHRVAADGLRVAGSVSAAAEHGLCDWILVCTKSFDSETVAREVAGARWRAGQGGQGEPRLALFQNGWGNAEHFAARLDPKRVFSARVITGFRRTRPAAVEVTVHAEPIRVGSLFGAPTSEAAELCRAIDAGGIPCEPTDSIAADLWAKMLYNCALNPLGALLGVPYGELAGSRATRAVMESVVAEVFHVMAKAGHATHWSGPDAYLADFYRRLLPPTALHESSMLQDLRAGRRTEIDALCGAVVKLGARHGVDAPVDAALHRLVRALEPRSEA